MANQYEEKARQQKAVNFAQHLRARGISSSDLASMHPGVVAHHAKSAGLKTDPSPETLDLVHKALKVYEQPPPEDPFAGL